MPYVSRRLFSTGRKKITVPNYTVLGKDEHTRDLYKAEFTLLSRISPLYKTMEQRYDIPVHLAARMLGGLNPQISVNKYISGCHAPHLVKDFKIVNFHGKEFLNCETEQSVDLAAKKILLFIDCEGNLKEEKIW